MMSMPSILLLVLLLALVHSIVVSLKRGRLLRGVLLACLLVPVLVFSGIYALGRYVQYMSPDRPIMQFSASDVSMPGIQITNDSVNVQTPEGMLSVTPHGVTMSAKGQSLMELQQQARDPMIPEKVFKEAWEISSAQQGAYRRRMSRVSPLFGANAAEPLPAEAPEQPVPASSSRLLADHFDPNVYQSEASAARGLTNQVAKVLDTVIPGQADPQNIVVKGKLSSFLQMEVVNLLQQAYPSARTVYSKTSTRIEGGTVLLYFDRQPYSGGDTEDGEASQAESSPSDPSRVSYVDPRTGQIAPMYVLRVDATGEGGKISRSAVFTDKPWVDDFASFVSSTPGHNWIMAVSRSPATSVEEAEQQAMDDAVSQLEPRVRERMARQGQDTFRVVLKRQIRTQLADSGLIADRFVQRFDRPYGEVWQAALLIDASSRKVRDLAGQCDRLLAAQNNRTRQTALAIAGIVAVVCIVYVFLNSVTRGYFAWSLRGAALAIIAGGVYLVLLLV